MIKIDLFNDFDNNGFYISNFSKEVDDTISIKLSFKKNVIKKHFGILDINSVVPFFTKIKQISIDNKRKEDENKKLLDNIVVLKKYCNELMEENKKLKLTNKNTDEYIRIDQLYKELQTEHHILKQQYDNLNIDLNFKIKELTTKIDEYKKNIELQKKHINKFIKKTKCIKQNSKFDYDENGDKLYKYKPCTLCDIKINNKYDIFENDNIKKQKYYEKKLEECTLKINGYLSKQKKLQHTVEIRNNLYKLYQEVSLSISKLEYKYKRNIIMKEKRKKKLEEQIKLIKSEQTYQIKQKNNKKEDKTIPIIKQVDDFINKKIKNYLIKYNNIKQFTKIISA